MRRFLAPVLALALVAIPAAAVSAAPSSVACTVLGDGFVHATGLKPGKTYSIAEYTATAVGRAPAFVADATGTYDEVNFMGDALTFAEVRNASDHVVATCTP